MAMKATTRATAIFGVAITLAASRHAGAFPPYRSTDADSADPWTLEGRLGVLRYTRDSGENAYTTPLLRVNFGFPHRLELITEFEYEPAGKRLGDAAAGLKWIPYFEKLSLGIETLVLLPTTTDGGTGVESQLLATQRWESVRLHANVGGFYDARPWPIEEGWRGSVLAELDLDRVRPGAEVFAKQAMSEPVVVQGGAGVIVKLGPVDVRAGAHLGLTSAAADFVASLWVASKLELHKSGAE
jgi:hypothetical protein